MMVFGTSICFRSVVSREIYNSQNTWNLQSLGEFVECFDRNAFDPFVFLHECL